VTTQADGTKLILCEDGTSVVVGEPDVADDVQFPSDTVEVPDPEDVPGEPDTSEPMELVYPVPFTIASAGDVATALPYTRFEGGLSITTLPNGSAINLPNLRSVVGDLVIDSYGLSSFAAPALKSVSGAFKIMACERLGSVSTPELVTLGSFVSIGCLGNTVIAGNPTILFPKLETISGDVQVEGGLAGSSTLGGFVAPALTGLGGTLLLRDTTMSYLSLPSLKAIGAIKLQSKAGPAYLDLPKLEGTTLGVEIVGTGVTCVHLGTLETITKDGLKLEKNPITRFFAPSLVAITGTASFFDNSFLPECYVDQLLSQATVLGLIVVDKNGDGQCKPTPAACGE